eukprot:11174784-Lingulodinium_polyedra.AAC.1
MEIGSDKSKSVAQRSSSKRAKVDLSSIEIVVISIEGARRSLPPQASLSKDVQNSRWFAKYTLWEL